MNNMPIPVAGVDISKRFSDMCILKPDNSIFRRVKIYHDLTSMQRSLAALQDAEKEFENKPVIVMESTSPNINGLSPVSSCFHSISAKRHIGMPLISRQHLSCHST